MHLHRQPIRSRVCLDHRHAGNEVETSRQWRLPAAPRPAGAMAAVWLWPTVHTSGRGPRKRRWARAPGERAGNNISTTGDGW
jgi:hypothetical protein